MCGLLGILTFFGEPFWIGDFFFILQQHYLLYVDTTHVFFFLFPLFSFAVPLSSIDRWWGHRLFSWKSGDRVRREGGAQFMSMLCRGAFKFCRGRRRRKGEEASCSPPLPPAAALQWRQQQQQKFRAAAKKQSHKVNYSRQQTRRDPNRNGVKKETSNFRISIFGKSRTTFGWREGASVPLAESRKVLLKPRSAQTSGGGREERKGKRGKKQNFHPPPPPPPPLSGTSSSSSRSREILLHFLLLFPEKLSAQLLQVGEIKGGGLTPFLTPLHFYCIALIFSAGWV